jgi:DNA polymerase
MLAWLAEQEDVVQTFAENGDVYKMMASKIYGKPVDQIDKAQRQIGKVVILGAGYGVGHHKLQLFLKMQAGVEVELDEAKRIIDIYRGSNYKIAKLWKDAGSALRYMALGYAPTLGRPGVLDARPDRIIMPSGIPIVYSDLKGTRGDSGVEYSYAGRSGRTYIYGGKLVENLCQSLARDIIGEQMLKIAKRYRVVLTVHDSVVACVREEEASEAQMYIEECMRWTPDWAAGLPVNCESEVGRRYGG